MLARTGRTMMSLRTLSLATAALAASALADVDPHPAMLRYPDISATHIVFMYGNDLWLVPRDGGTAQPLASPAGPEMFPKFSLDGSVIAFQGNYDGNRDLYTIPATGGVPTRVTHHPASERLSDWTPDGQLLFASSGLAGIGRTQQLFTVGSRGGLPTALSIPYGSVGAVSPDGAWLAYTPYSTDFRTWKRYRGGWATDIWLFNLRDRTAFQATDWEGTDTSPMWHGLTLYYLSDRGANHRQNIWAYDSESKQHRQVTNLDGFDVKFPSVGPGPEGQGEIIFQHGAGLYRLDLQTQESTPIQVTIPGDRPRIRPQTIDAAEFIQSFDISSTGKRAVLQARGDIWTLPAEHGSPRNLTRSNGVAERDPAWSPDGRWIAYFSDASGEYELCVTQSDGKGETRQLTRDGKAFRYQPAWSPDSKRIVFTDKTGAIYRHDIEAAQTRLVDMDPWAWDNSPRDVSWSHDGRWIAYTRTGGDGLNSTIWIHNVETGENKQVTSGMFNDTSPRFDRMGDWLFYASHRAFAPTYADIDTTFIYGGSEVLLAAPLRLDVKSPWLPKNDEEEWKDDSEKDDDEAQTQPEEADDGEDGEEDDDNGDDEEEDENGEEESAPAKPDDGVSGTWEGAVNLPEAGQINFTLTLDLAEDGTTVTGTLSSMLHSGTLSGTYDPASKKLELNAVIEGAPPVTLSLTIEGESLSGTATYDGNTIPITATRTSKHDGGGGDGKDNEKEDKPREKVDIDFDGFEARAMILPVPAGQFGALAVNDKNHLLYARQTTGLNNTGAGVKIFDLKDEKKEEKEVAGGATAFAVSADGKKIIVQKGGAYTIQGAAAGGGESKAVSTAGMSIVIDPRVEWRQVFHEAWRVQRDFFYDPNMHGVDWTAMREHYAAMLDDCATRDDVSYVISELISELNVGHAYYFGGSTEDEPSVTVGMLACDFALENGAYRIMRIHQGAAWDADSRGPLSQPGIDVKEGEYLLSVNGQPLDTSRDPWAAFQRLADKPTILTVSAKPLLDDTAREVIVQPIANEGNLRYRTWIERNRAYVAEKTGGKVGYVYVPDTGVNGQTNLYRQFFGQIHKPALIIDERWNGGGQIPTRFIEMLNRPATNYWARRDGKDWTWPPDSHQGPKCMLINGPSGSGGDAFPFYFRQAGLGKLIGTRTWGGLVGISGNPGLIDGGYTSAPTFAFYETDGTWGIEGHGVDPDIPVLDDPSKMLDGADPQLDAAIAHILAELEAHPYTPPARPKYPDRRGMGLPDSDR